MAQRSLLLLLALMVVIAIVSGCASSPTQGEVLLAAVVGNKNQGVATTNQPVAPSQSSAPTPLECNGRGPDKFGARQACIDAMSSGECSYYTPKKTSKEKKGEGPYDVFHLHRDACVSMSIEGDKVAIVPQKSGTAYRSRNGVLFARNDCGNKVGEISYISPPPTQAQVQQAVASARNICAEKGYSGDEYFTGIDPKTGHLDCLYVEEVSFWDTKTGTVIKVVGVVVVVGAVVLYCSKHDCKFWKHDKPAPSNPPPPPPKGPINPWGIGGPAQ